MEQPLQFVFIAAAATGSAYFLSRRRRFDFFALGFASSLVYFLPGFFGFVRSSSNFLVPEPLQTGTYLVFLAVLVATVTGAIVFDQVFQERPAPARTSVSLRLTAEIAVMVAFLGLLATLATSGAELFSPRKSDVIDSVGRWHILFRFAAIYAVIFAVLRKDVLPGIVGGAFLLFDLFIGFRLGVVIGLLSAATLLLNRRGAQVLLQSQKRMLAAGIVAVAAIFLYKRVYIAVKLGLWDTVIARLTSPDLSFVALMSSEPFGTQTILNEVIRTGFTVDAGHLKTTAALLVPFSNMLGAEIQSFNDIFQQELFGGVARGGLANNIWAQMFAIGGWFGIAIIVPVYVGLLAIGSWLLSSSRGATLALIAVVFTFIAFYIHRNDVLYTLVLLRRSLFLWVVFVLPAMVLIDMRRREPV